MSGKGSAPRPFSNRAEFEANFDAIFGQRRKVAANPSPSVTDSSEQAEGSPGLPNTVIEASPPDRIG